MPNPLKLLIPPRLLRWILPFWTILLIAGSLSSGQTKRVIGSTRLGEQGRPQEARLTGDVKHRVFHWLGFGSTAFLFLCLTRTAGEEALAATGTFALGVAIEAAQEAIYHGGFEWDDVRDDALAVAALYLLIAGGGVLYKKLAQVDAKNNSLLEEKKRLGRRAARAAVSTRLDG
jgi:hypothetical protein